MITVRRAMLVAALSASASAFVQAQIPKIDPADSVLERKGQLLQMVNPIGCRGQFGRQWVRSYGDRTHIYKRYRHDSDRECVHADGTREGRAYKRDWMNRHYYDKSRGEWVEKGGKWHKKFRSRTKGR